MVIVAPLLMIVNTANVDNNVTLGQLIGISRPTHSTVKKVKVKFTILH